MNVVTIDGPAGAGKTTIARAVAHALGWAYLDTGAMYRAVALAALEEGADVEDGDALAAIVRRRAIHADGATVSLDGRDVSGEIRRPRVTDAVSTVAAHPQVREALVRRQREIAERGQVVIEGRDIGTAVVPDARVKVFLTASLGTRATRRRDELGTAEERAQDVEQALERRDRADAERDHSPLARASDAVVIDSTEMGIDEVVARILELL